MQRGDNLSHTFKTPHSSLTCQPTSGSAKNVQKSAGGDERKRESREKNVGEKRGMPTFAPVLFLPLFPEVCLFGIR